VEIIVGIVCAAFGLWIIWQLFVLVGDMAERRGQDRFVWQIAALFLNPLGAMAILWLFCSIKSNPR